ncbi:hypothetical protein [Streptomyces sp. NPDC001480]|uniref:hypothetical protein n=1 Tax=Streptomyces sp. NPDC001480 TaxID=3364577 RepID=UPI0036D15779
MVSVAEPPLDIIDARGPGIHESLNRATDRFFQLSERLRNQLTRTSCLNARVLAVFNNLEVAVIGHPQHVTSRASEYHARTSREFEQVRLHRTGR